MALRCGEQFRRRYISNERIPPGIAAGRGTGVHKANDVNLRQKVITERDMGISDLKDAARDGFVHAFDNGVFLSKDDVASKNVLLNDGLNQTLKLTELYREKVSPSIQPIEVERKFVIDVGLAMPLSGIMDIQRHRKIDDLKTSSRKWPDDRIKTEIQPIFYSLAHEMETGIRPQFNYRILNINKGGDAKLQVQSITAEEKHYRALFAKIQVMIDMIQSGTYMPANPTAWWCSEKWCGYWSTCVYVGNREVKKWV